MLHTSNFVLHMNNKKKKELPIIAITLSQTRI